jgi:hypothetical protein
MHTERVCSDEEPVANRFLEEAEPDEELMPDGTVHAPAAIHSLPSPAVLAPGSLALPVSLALSATGGECNAIVDAIAGCASPVAELTYTAWCEAARAAAMSALQPLAGVLAIVTATSVTAA